MPCRRARQYPFNSTSYSTIFIRKRISISLRSICQSQVCNIEEILQRKSRQITSITTYHIPTKECVRVVEITSRHTCEPQKMLWHKRLIYSDKEQEELCLSMSFRVLAPSHFSYPEIESCKNSSYSTHTQYIMEMRNNIISQIRLQLLLPEGSDSLLLRLQNLICH